MAESEVKAVLKSFQGTILANTTCKQKTKKTAKTSAVVYDMPRGQVHATPTSLQQSQAAKLMQAKSWDQKTLEDLATVMVDASICGLGQAAPNPIRCIQKYFPQEVQ